MLLWVFVSLRPHHTSAIQRRLVFLLVAGSDPSVDVTRTELVKYLDVLLYEVYTALHVQSMYMFWVVYPVVHLSTDAAVTCAGTSTVRHAVEPGVTAAPVGRVEG